MLSTVELLVPIYYCSEELFYPIELCFSTLNACYPGIRVLAWDDGSPLPVPDHWPVIGANVVNLGYVRTVNKLLRESMADVIIVANDDLQFVPGCLDRYFTLEDGVIAAPRDSASGSLERFGAIFGMTRSTFNEMGLLDETFTNFCADEAYYNQAITQGIEVRIWPDITLPHVESATFKALGEKDRLLAEDIARRVTA